jgi:hypothetical protein
MHAIRSFWLELWATVSALKPGAISTAKPEAIAVRRVIPKLLDSFEFMRPFSCSSSVLTLPAVYHRCIQKEVQCDVCRSIENCNSKWQQRPIWYQLAWGAEQFDVSCRFFSGKKRQSRMQYVRICQGILRLIVTKIKMIAKTVLSVAILCGVSISISAQSTTQGAIYGTVFDTTSAVITKATVTIHNDASNEEIALTTDASGNFHAPLLEPGTYTVSVAAAGFQGSRLQHVIVHIGQVTSLLPHLVSGLASTTVEVTESVPTLSFESPDFPSNINTHALQGIPVNNRRWSSLAQMTPGVIADSSGFGLVSVHGISTLLNNVEIDGADDNQAYYSEERGRTREAYTTSASAVREFAVNAGVYPAEYGRAAGGVINSVTNSGTNDLHGQFYFYDRDSNWSAYQEHTLQTVANYASGNPVPTSFTSVHYKPEDVRKIYGFTVGGPIIRNKLFWLYTYDQHARIFPAIGSPGTPATFFAVPDTALAAGANSVLPPPTSGVTYPTYTCNIATGYLTPPKGSTTAAPALDAQACTFAAREGLTSYSAGVAAYSAGLASLLPDLGFTPRAGYQEINTPKLDWQINSKQHVLLLYHRLRWDSPGGVQTAGVVPYAIDAQGTDFVKLDYTVAKLTSLIRSNISNELLYQYGRELNDEGQQPFSAYTATNLVAKNGNVPAVVLAGSTGFELGSPYYSHRNALPDERKWQIEDTLYYGKNHHIYNFGVDMLHNDDLINALSGSSSAGTSAGNGIYTYSYIGNYLADVASKNAATGTCDGAQQSAATSSASAVGTYQCYAAGGYGQSFGNPSFGIQTFDYALFAQDNWKLLSRLTIDLGMRYDFEFLSMPPANLTNPAVPQTSNHPSDKNNFGPRIGFAYDMFGSGKAVLRGGYGMYYGRVSNGILLNTLMNSGSLNGQYTLAYSPSAGSTTPIFPSNVSTAAAAVTPSVYYLDSHLQNPMVHELDLIVQQEIGMGTVASLSYLGALGRELPNFINTNLDAATVQTTNIDFIDITGSSPIPNGKIIPVRTYIHYINPSYQGITDVISNINSSYNNFVAEVQNRSLRNFQFDANYTWSHSLDYNQSATATVLTNNWIDPYATARSNYGNSIYNVPDRLVLYVLYNFPNVARKDSLLSYGINGWSLDNSFQAQSGLPYSAAISGSTSSNSISTGWYGTGVTSYIPILGRNTFKYPRHEVDDIRIQKKFLIKERCKLELMLSAFNVANKQNIDGLNTTAYNLASTGPATGIATYQTSFQSVSTSNNSGFLYTPREVEIAARISF